MCICVNELNCSVKCISHHVFLSYKSLKATAVEDTIKPGSFFFTHNFFKSIRRWDIKTKLVPNDDGGLGSGLSNFQMTKLKRIANIMDKRIKISNYLEGLN